MTDTTTHCRALGRATNPDAVAIRERNRKSMHDLLRRETAARSQVQAPACAHETKRPGLLARALERARGLM